MPRARAATPRHRILTAALTTFGNRGVEGASVAEVAKAAGMSKQALMHHYPTKEVLRDAVYDHLAERLRAIFPSVAGELVRMPQDYGAVISLVADRLTHTPDVARFLVHELLTRPEAVSKWLRTEAAPWLGLVRGIIEQDRERNQGRGEKVDVDAHLTVLTGQMLMLSALMPRKDKQWWARVQTASLSVMRLGSHLGSEKKSRT